MLELNSAMQIAGGHSLLTGIGNGGHGQGLLGQLSSQLGNSINLNHPTEEKNQSALTLTSIQPIVPMNFSEINTDFGTHAAAESSKKSDALHASAAYNVININKTAAISEAVERIQPDSNNLGNDAIRLALEIATKIDLAA